MKSVVLHPGETSPPRSFDVICAGAALWNVAASSLPDALAANAGSVPAGGAVGASVALARRGLRVGLATVLTDDHVGRALCDEIAKANVNVGGVELSPPSSGLFVVERGARRLVAFRDEEEPVAVPDGWIAEVLLLSGMTPAVAHAAALCKAGRAARRAGSLVIVDLNARWQSWKGRDARAIRMIVREADVVSCTVSDLFCLNTSPSALRSAMRSTAVLAVSDGLGKAWATGPFGEVVATAERSGTLRLDAREDGFASAICAELARSGQRAIGSEVSWARALRNGHRATIENGPSSVALRGRN